MDVRSVQQYFVEHPVRASQEFHMLLMQDWAWLADLRRLEAMFAMPAPRGCGQYNHHDGLRLTEPLNRRKRA